jgi:hypothetical protein
VNTFRARLHLTEGHSALSDIARMDVLPHAALAADQREGIVSMSWTTALQTSRILRDEKEPPSRQTLMDRWYLGGGRGLGDQNNMLVARRNLCKRARSGRELPGDERSHRCHALSLRLVVVGGSLCLARESFSQFEPWNEP